MLFLSPFIALAVLFWFQGPVALAQDGALTTRPAQDYLLFMDPSAAYVEEFNWISSRLNELASEPSDPAELVQILEQSRTLVIDTIKGRQTSDAIQHPEYRLLHLRDVLDELLKLSDPVNDYHQDCHVLNTMQHFLDSIDAIFGGIEEFIELLNDEDPESRLGQHGHLFQYLKHHGIQHTTSCLVALTKSFKEKADMSKFELEVQMDQLLTPSADPSLGTDEELLKTATAYDFTSDDYDELMMLKSLETDSLSSPRMGENYNHQVMAELCADLRADLYDTFVTYDLAKALAPEVAGQIVYGQGVRFFKLDEYFRLCNEWKSR